MSDMSARRQAAVSEAAFNLKRHIHDYLRGSQDATGNAYLEMVAESAAHAMIAAMDDVVAEYLRRGEDPSSILALLRDYGHRVAEYYRDTISKALDAMAEDDFAAIRQAYGLGGDGSAGSGSNNNVRSGQ